MNNRSKSTLFLMEQLIVILVFAICAAACVKIFVASFIMETNAKDTSSALLVAESAAECYKAVGGDAVQMAELLNGTSDLDTLNESVAVYYNEKWIVCGPSDASFVLKMTSDRPNMQEGYNPIIGDLSVSKITGEEIIALTVAARGAAL